MRELDQYRTNTGDSLAEISNHSPTVVIFLRHSGCPFCRQALADLSAHRQELERSGCRIVLVCMEGLAAIGPLVTNFHLEDLPIISDPTGELYETFGLARTNSWNVLGPRVWWPGLKAVLLEGRWPGKPGADIFRLPGVFLLYRGRVLKEFRPQSSAGRASFAEFASCAIQGAPPDEKPK